MASILQQLENNEAILLMYLADELPSEDRLEVEQMLRNDAGLRAMLDRLRETQRGSMSFLGELDAAIPLPDEDGAVRRLIRTMRKRQLELAARPAEAPPAAPLHKRLPAWAYPIVSVAAAIIIALGLWGVGVFDFGPKGGITDSTGGGEDVPELELVERSVNAPLDDARDRLHQLDGVDDDDNDRLVLMTF
jgi:hypothetical protein